MNSSPRFWLVAAVLVALSVALEARPHAAPATGPATPPTEALRRFLEGETDGALEPVVTRRRMPDWAGWRFTVEGCQATALPLTLGGDYDLDARRQVGPGERLVFVHAGRVYAEPPSLQASLGRIAALAKARLMGAPIPPNYYIGLIQTPGCEAAAGLPWGRFAG